ncbi:hypothetical protein [Microvirga yunnanensis]|uniref:hypothetical protein n=1 Tax=Microvirga yunnanensis TaxID=2953740 RepID=UPI0021C8FD8F|nr:MULTISPECIES: hypothetical protein [unclassified Microvirga]
MPDGCGSHPTTRKHAAALDNAASDEACLSEELALLASFLEDHGCPCVAAAFWQSARHRRVQSLIHSARAVGARIV